MSHVLWRQKIHPHPLLLLRQTSAYLNLLDWDSVNVSIRWSSHLVQARGHIGRRSLRTSLDLEALPAQFRPTCSNQRYIWSSCSELDCIVGASASATAIAIILLYCENSKEHHLQSCESLPASTTMFMLVVPQVSFFHQDVV